MAKVRISRREAEGGMLPRVCALTGVPTEDVKKKAFLWQPPWVGVLILGGVLPYVIVASIVQKRMTVQVPLIKEKHGHWAWRTLALLGGVFASLGLIIGSVVLLENGPKEVFVVALVVGLVLFLAVLIAGLIISNQAIRPTEITDTDITLVNVHPNFVAALEDERDAEDEEYERNRARRKNKYADDDDDRPRRRSKYDDDDDDDNDDDRPRAKRYD